MESFCPSVVLSVCPIVSAQYLLKHLTILFFYTKLGMVVYFHEAMCQAEKLVHYLQCQGHSDGLYNQNMTNFTISSKVTIFTISSRLLVCSQSNLVDSTASLAGVFFWKNGITAFKVKVTVKIQNDNECSSRQYLLHHRTFCYQTWYGYAAS